MFIDANQSKAPKERRLVATGEAPRNPWVGLSDVLRPNGAQEDSIKNIFFLEGNIVCPQQLQQLISKGLFAMMFRLPLNVAPNFWHLRLADAENAIAFLPCKRRQLRKRFMNPAGGIGLQISHECRNGLVRSPAEQDVNVVSHAADFQNCPAFPAKDAAQIVMDARTEIWRQPRFAVFGAEYQMELQVMKRAGHGRSLVRRPAGAEEFILNHPPRVALRSTRGYRLTLRRSLNCQRLFFP
jgi:hypothetical protein